MRRRDLAIAGALVVVLSAAAPALAEDVSVPALDRRVQAALAKVYAFEYEDRPFSKVIADIADRAGIEIVLDPKAAEGGGEGIPITWASKKSSVERALRWVTRFAGLEFRVLDGAVFISTAENLVGKAVQKVYDVRDVSGYPRDEPGPGIDINPPCLVERVTQEVTPTSLAELIQSRIRPATWAPELGTSIEERDGLLMVMQKPEIHERIEALLHDLRAMRRRTVRVGVAVAPSEAGMDALIEPAGDGLLTRGEITTLDGVVAHAIWGTKTHYVASKHLAWPEVRAPDDYWRPIEHEVIWDDEGAPRIIVVKTPAPPPSPPPPGEGKIVPVVGALLDGVLVEVLPRLHAGGNAAELSLRLVISRPREMREPAAGEEIATPTVDYSRLMTTVSIPVGEWTVVGKMAVRRDGKDVPVDVLARVALPEE